MSNNVVSRLKKLLLFVFLGCLSPLPLFASGFSVAEQDAAGTGDNDAGGAASALDASTAWYNPAGLVLLTEPQLILGFNDVNTSLEFSGTVQNNINYLGKKGETTPITGFYQSGQAQGGENNLIPFFYYALPINSKLVVALSFTTPFGLKTDYSDDSLVRYAATETNLLDYDLSPSFGFKLSPQFSLGFGLDVQYLTADFDQVVGLGSVGPMLGLSSYTDTLSTNEANDWALGWHMGALYQFTPNTRLGAAYHSQVNGHLSGKSEFSGPLATLATDGKSSTIVSTQEQADIVLPALTTISLYHNLNQKWSLMGSLNYVGWSALQNISIENIAAVEQASFNQVLQGSPVLIPTTTNTVLAENLHNTLGVYFGAHYQISDKLLWRFGVGIDQDPSSDQSRDLRLPTAEEYSASVGLHYQISKKIGLDAAWSHFFMPSETIDDSETVGQQQTNVIGNSASSANIYALQLDVNFG